MYKKLIQGGMLIAVVLLFIVPLAMQAAEGSPFSTSFPLLKRGFFQNNILVKVVEETVSPIGTNRDFWVIRDVPFTLSWDAKAPLASDDTQISSAGMFCSKSWEDSFRVKGESTGYLSGARTFFMTCSGLGGGIIAQRSVKVGDIDLIIGSFEANISPNGNTTDETDYLANSPWTVTASVKNAGNVNLSSPRFNVTFYYGLTNIPSSFMSQKTVNTLKGGDSITVTHQQPAGNEPGTTLWFKVCADVDNVVPERKSDGSDGGSNNCSAVKGPYRFVRPQ